MNVERKPISRDHDSIKFCSRVIRLFLVGTVCRNPVNLIILSVQVQQCDIGVSTWIARGVASLKGGTGNAVYKVILYGEFSKKVTIS